MFKALSLPLLALVLHVQLCSSAPIPAKAVESSALAEEPGPEELAPVTEDHSHIIEGKESIQKKRVAEEVAHSRAESPPKEDIPVTAKELEQVSVGEQVYDDPDGGVSQESVPLEPLAADLEVSSEEDNVPVKTAFVESSLDEVGPVVFVGSESTVQPYVEGQTPETPNPVTLVGASEDGAAEGNKEPSIAIPDDKTEVEEALLPLTPEEREEEEPVVLAPAEREGTEAGQGELPVGEPAPQESLEQEAPVIIPVEPGEQNLGQEGNILIILSEEEAAEKDGEEEEVFALVILDSALDKEESVALIPVELEEQVEPAVEETAPQEVLTGDPVVIVPLVRTEEEVELEEQSVEKSVEVSSPEDPVGVVPLDAVEEEPELEEPDQEESIEEVAPEDPIVVVPLDTVEEEPELEESIVESSQEDPVGLVPLNPAEEEPELEEPDEEESIEELSPEDPVGLVPLDPAEEEPELEEQVDEESTAPEDPVGLVPLNPAEEEPELEEQIDEESIEEIAPEDPVGLVPLNPAEEQPELEEPDEEEFIDEVGPEDPIVIVPLVPVEEELDHGQVENVSSLIVSIEAPDEETPVQYTDIRGGDHLNGSEENSEANLDTNEELLPSTPEGEESLVLVQEELGTEDRYQKEPAEYKTAPEKPAVINLVEPTSDETAPEDPILIITLDDQEQDGSKGHIEEIVVQSEPFRKDAVLEEATAPEENDEIAVTSETIEKVMEQALVNRGAVLGAALFTLMSFISVGFVWTTISKKLR